MKKLCIIIHMYYEDLYSEFKQYLDKIPIEYDLYISVVNNTNKSFINKIKKDFSHVHIFKLPNQGSDIGPFFEIMSYLIKNDINYKYLLKIHTKKSLRKKNPNIGENWRKKLIEPLINNISSNLKLLEKDDVGLIASKQYIKKIDNNKKHWWFDEGKKYIDDMLEKYEIKNNDRTFVMSSMFLCKFNVLKKYMSKNIIGQSYFKEVYNSSGNTTAHAGERMFCRFFIEENLKIVGVK